MVTDLVVLILIWIYRKPIDYVSNRLRCESAGRRGGAKRSSSRGEPLPIGLESALAPRRHLYLKTITTIPNSTEKT